MAPEPTPTGFCFCGCGATTSPGRFFISTHDRKAETRIIREHYGSIAAFVRAHESRAGYLSSVTRAHTCVRPAQTLWVRMRTFTRNRRSEHTKREERKGWDVTIRWGRTLDELGKRVPDSPREAGWEFHRELRGTTLPAGRIQCLGDSGRKYKQCCGPITGDPAAERSEGS